MRLLLFSGFLGSGKTTLILALAGHLSARGITSCIIVNEIGEIGIDGRVLAEGGLQVYEITAGCICCQIGVDLVRTLEEIAARYHPEVVMVEASGIATPAGVRDALTYYPGEPFEETTAVTLVDPTRLEALIEVMTPLIESQIAGADQVVITKTDQATPGEVERALEAAARLNPAAPVWTVLATDGESLAPLLARLEREAGADAGAAVGSSPPALAADLEPYSVALSLVAGEGGADAGAVCTRLLPAVGEECDRAGATMIGHIKCHGRFPGGRVHGHVTSLRTGVDCGGDLERRMEPGESMALDLAVLVYGLSRSAIEAIVREALETLAPELTPQPAARDDAPA